jgi:small subunit ribosomal protein S6
METDSETLKEYERIMGLNEDVLRFMNIRIEEVDEAPSIMMQAKSERPSRGPRDDDRRDDRRDDRPKSDNNAEASDDSSESAEKEEA